MRYLISDRRLCGGLPGLLDLICRQIAAGVDYIQIREKDLCARELFEFTRAVVLARANAPSKILVNSRADVARAAGADGVHLPSRAPFATLPGLIVARSCHTIAEIQQSRADFVTFSPIFESPGKGSGIGLQALSEASRIGIPVFALGGITWQNATLCTQAGAAGIAGIRLFLDSGDLGRST